MAKGSACQDQSGNRQSRSTLAPSLGTASTGCGNLLFSDIDLFMSRVDAPVIGVTGTNGKSTVVSLVGHLLQASGLSVQ